MGNGNTTKTRYIGGKSLMKYFTEDVWPTNIELFDKLHMDEKKGYELFRTFANIDVNEDGLVDLKECFGYIGGQRTKFTERIFYHVDRVDDKGHNVYGLKFRDFTIAVWQYCTLTYAGLARMAFEVLDPGHTDFLEKVDIQTICKMLYNTPEHDDHLVDFYPFDIGNRLSKMEFMHTSSFNTALIQPAIGYQTRVRKKIGGVSMWTALMNFRVKYFYMHDNQSDCLEDALEAILRSNMFSGLRKKELTAEERLENQKNKLREDKIKAENELKMRQKQLENEEKIREMNAEDRKMKMTQRMYAEKRAEFEQEEFLLEDIQRRHDMRQLMYELFDVSIEAAKEYWESKVRREIETMTTSETDHEARYQDYSKTPDAKMLHAFYTLIYVYEAIEEAIKMKNMKSRKYDENKKSEKQMICETTLAELYHLQKTVEDKSGDNRDKAKRMNQLRTRNFDDENKFATQNAKMGDYRNAEHAAHKELSLQLKTKTIAEFQLRIAQEAEERRRDYIRREFDIATNFGSRITRYVCCKLL